MTAGPASRRSAPARRSPMAPRATNEMSKPMTRAANAPRATLATRALMPLSARSCGHPRSTRELQPPVRGPQRRTQCFDDDGRGWVDLLETPLVQPVPAFLGVSDRHDRDSRPLREQEAVI